MDGRPLKRTHQKSRFPLLHRKQQERINPIFQVCRLMSHTYTAPQSETEYPLSVGERAMWFLHQLVPGTSAYNISMSMRLRPQGDAGLLRRVLAQLVERHALMRTAYVERDGMPVHQVLRHVEPFLEHVDASGWSEELLRKRVHEA